MRVCDQCHIKMPPYQPRKRVGDRLLCGKCRENPNGYPHTLISAEAKANSNGTYIDEYWPDTQGLNPGCDVHPLLAPIPNIAWENYAKKRWLMGKPVVPMKTLRRGRDLHKKSVRKQAKLPDKPQDDAEAQHMRDHLATWHGATQRELGDWTHDELHDNHQAEHLNHMAGHVHDDDEQPVGLHYQGATVPHAQDLYHSELVGHLFHNHRPRSPGHPHAQMSLAEQRERYNGLTPEQLNEQHNRLHATLGHEADPVHTHAPPISSKIAHGEGDEHAPVRDHDRLYQHLMEEHPEVGVENLRDHMGHSGVVSIHGLRTFHEGLHGLPNDSHIHPANGHWHTKPVSPDLKINMHRHLGRSHGLADEVTGQFTPDQAAAHHQHLHQANNDDVIGHSHMSPGGPEIEPTPNLANPHHYPRRSTHPANFEWYHGASGGFQGPPVSATELAQRDIHSRFGEGDWNTHLGSHWTSLHEMAKGFGSGRVIHAHLRMRSPIVYNSLNHMAHDAYDRLVAAGEIDDGDTGEKLVGHHADDTGGVCCSNRLLSYAQGGNWRYSRDGMHGLQKYRDSLRADGHDGILVRNQVDSPAGHWNAIPLSPHDIDIKDSDCRDYHGDARASDTGEHTHDPDTTEGWVHPKPFKPYFGVGKNRHPSGEEIKAFKQTAKRADFGDPDYQGKWEDGRHLSDEDDEQYCSDCGDYGHTDDDHNEYCSVCEEENEHGHSPEDVHPYCDHCEDLADHDSDQHRDDYDEHPDFHRHEDYCPHCGHEDKDHRWTATCSECKHALPDWNFIRSHGQLSPYAQGHKPGQEEFFRHPFPAKEPEPDKYRMEPHGGDGTYDSVGNVHWLQNHLEHHHGSDPEFHRTMNGEWDHRAAYNHHMWLHQNKAAAHEAGFFHIDHQHEHLSEPKQAHQMTDAELHVHLMGDHRPGSSDLAGVPNAQDRETMLRHHQLLHRYNDEIEWGERGWGPKPDREKLRHSHVANHTDPLPNHPEDLHAHLALEHGTQRVKDLLGGLKTADITQEHMEAAHQHLHQGIPPREFNMRHVHDPGDGEMVFPEGEQGDQKAAIAGIRHHMLHGHGLLTGRTTSYETAESQHTAAHDHTLFWPHDHGDLHAQPHEDMTLHLVHDHGLTPEDAFGWNHLTEHYDQHPDTGAAIGPYPQHSHTEGLDQVMPKSHQPGPWSLGSDGLPPHHLWDQHHCPKTSVGDAQFHGAMHNFLHAHPEHAEAHGSVAYEGHHDHNHAGSMVQGEQPSYDDVHDAHALHKHLKEVHDHHTVASGEAKHHFGDLKAEHDSQHAEGTFNHSHPEPEPSPKDVASTPIGLSGNAGMKAHLLYDHGLAPTVVEHHVKTMDQAVHHHNQDHSLYQHSIAHVHEPSAHTQEHPTGSDLYGHLVDEHEMTPDEIGEHGGAEFAHDHAHDYDEQTGSDFSGHTHGDSFSLKSPPQKQVAHPIPQSTPGFRQHLMEHHGLEPAKGTGEPLSEWSSLIHQHIEDHQSDSPPTHYHKGMPTKESVRIGSMLTEHFLTGAAS